MAPLDDDGVFEVDLHGLNAEQALRRLAQELHAARVRGALHLRVITGRGWGNREQKPILREKVAAYLRSEAGRALGAIDVQTSSKGGALEVRLAQRSNP